MYRQIAQGNRVVIRRVGGLEVRLHPIAQQAFVIRRVGGLEDYEERVLTPARVIRRVGGLEAVGFMQR